MSLTEALSIAFTTGGGRKLPEGQVDRADQVPWVYGIIGLAVLVIVQVGLLYFPGSDLGAEVLRDLAFVAFAALAAPFVLFFIIGALTGNSARVPAAFLYLGIVLAALQVVSSVLSNFGSTSSGFLIGVLGAVNFLAARNFLKLGWPLALVVAILVVGAFLGSFLLLLALPSGRLFT
jgi:hypothetical protein